MLKDKTILYIVHKYNSFQKDPIEEAAKYFKKVYVLVRYKPLTQVTKFIPLKRLRVFDESNVIDLNKLPKNVQVIKTPVWYLPFGFLNKLVGDAHLKAVEKVIERNNLKFDIIHCHFIWTAGYVGAKLKQKYDVPLVITGHGFDVYQLPFKNSWWRKKTRSIIEFADKVITVSEFNKKYLLRIGINEKKIEVVNNGFNDKFFFQMNKDKSRKNLGIENTNKIVVAVGNLEKVKGYDLLIKAIHILKSKYIKLQCYIVGGGSQYNRLKSLVEELNLDDCVFFVGAKPHNEIPLWMNSCDTFVISSRIESASVVVLEAMACGSPIVATKVGIISDVVNNKVGVIVNKNNEISLAAGIEWVLNQDWNRTVISKQASKYTWNNAVVQIRKIYDICLR